MHCNVWQYSHNKDNTVSTDSTENADNAAKVDNTDSTDSTENAHNADNTDKWKKEEPQSTNHNIWHFRFIQPSSLHQSIQYKQCNVDFD